MELLKVDNFGSVDADNDDLLLKSFEDHKAYKDIIANKRFLIVGRKGAGKTAIFKKIITTRESDVFTYGHTFTDYPWHFHEKQARIGIPDFDKFTHSWKYLILLTISKILLNQDQSIPFDEESLDYLTKIESFITDSYGSRDPDLTQIFSPSKKLRLKPNFTLDFGLLKGDISPESVPIEELPIIVQDVNRNLLDYIIKCLNTDNKYYIAFDQLDLGFDPKNGDYVNRLIGLILASRDINLFAKNNGKQLLTTVFLRNDIYDNLHFDDKNKITENFMSMIEWDTDSTENKLKDLMEKRFQVIIGDGKSKVDWDHLFDEGTEMPGHQSKYQYILDRTFLRPRDIIKFTNTVLDKYKLRSRVGEDTSLNFINKDLHDSKSDYGRYFIREIDDELHKHDPDFQQYISIIKGINIYRFSKEKFVEECEKRKGLFNLSKTPDEILMFLYDFSLIGYFIRGGKGFGGSEYIFKYKEHNQEFDLTATLFQVHLGLLDGLGLKRYEKK